MISLAKKDLPNDVESLRDLVLHLSRQVRLLSEQVEQLTEHRFGRKTEKIDPNQLLLFAGSKPKDVEVDKEDVVVPSYRRRKHRGHGREPFPAHLPRNKIICDPPEAERGMSRFPLKLGGPGSQPSLYATAWFLSRLLSASMTFDISRCPITRRNFFSA